MADVGSLARSIDNTSTSVSKLANTTSRLAAENAKALASADKFAKSLTSITQQATKALTSLEGLAGIAGGVFGSEAIRGVLQYNKSLYDLGKSAAVTNRSFSEMQSAIEQLHSETKLSTAGATTLYKTIHDGISGTRLSAQSTRELAKVMADEFGPSLSDTVKATQQLLDLNNRLPGTLSAVRSGLPFKEYQQLIEAQISLGKLTAKEAEMLLRSKRAYEGVGSEVDKQAKKFRELEEIQAELTKQFEDFMLAIGKPLADVLKNLGTSIAPFLEKLNKFLADKKAQEFIALLAKGAILKFGVDLAAGPLKAIAGLGALRGGGGSLASSLLGGAAPVPVIIVGDKTGGLGGAGTGLAGRFAGAVGGRGNLIAAGAAGAYGLGSLADTLGRDTLGGGAASTGSYALGGASALGALGPQAAALGATFFGVGEMATQLGKAFGLVDKGVGSFGESLSDAGSYLWDLATGSKTLQASEVKRTVSAAKEARDKSTLAKNEAVMANAFAKLSEKDKKLLGLDKEPAKAMELFRKQVADKFAGGDLTSKRLTEGEVQGITAGARDTDRISKLEDMKHLREAIIKAAEAEASQLKVLVGYAIQYGGSFDDVRENISKVQTQLDQQTLTLQENLKAANQAVESAKKRLELAKGGEEEVQVRRDLKGALETQSNIQGQLNTQRQKGLGIQMEALSFAESEVRAHEDLLKFAARFGKGQDAITKEISAQSKAYDEELASLDGIISRQQAEYAAAKPEARKGIEDTINRLLNQRSAILIKQADTNLNINVGRQAELDTIMSSVGLAKEQLELSEALYGGFGATLEARMRIYKELEKGVKKTEEMIIAQEAVLKNNPEDLKAKQELNKLEQDRVRLQKEQVNLTKALRDGYLDALTTFTNVEGTFSKIISTREANLGAAILKGYASGSMTLGVAGAGGTGPIAKFTQGGGLSLSGQAELDRRRAGYEKVYGPEMRGSLAAGVGKGTFVEDVRARLPGSGDFEAGKKAEQQFRDLGRMRGLGLETAPAPTSGNGVNININVKGEYAKKIVDEVSALMYQKLNELMNPHGSTGRTDDNTYNP